MLTGELAVTVGVQDVAVAAAVTVLSIMGIMGVKVTGIMGVKVAVAALGATPPAAAVAVCASLDKAGSCTAGALVGALQLTNASQSASIEAIVRLLFMYSSLYDFISMSNY
jgi:hypothetical protein